MSEETSFYSDQRSVRVTDKRVIIKNTTYSLANITSVSTSVEEPSHFGPTICIVLGGLLIIAGFRALHGAAYAVLGVLLAAVGYFWYRGCKPLWHLRISSASGESTPLSSYERAWIENIARAINEAMIHRT